MINLNDTVYRKHKNCKNIEIRWFRFGSKISQLRCYCVTHQKWLHTFNRQETEMIKANYPEMIVKAPQQAQQYLGVKTRPVRESRASLRNNEQAKIHTA